MPWKCGSSFLLSALKPLGCLVFATLVGVDGTDRVTGLYSKSPHGVCNFAVPLEAEHIAFKTLLCFNLGHGRRGRYKDFLRLLADLADEYLERAAPGRHSRACHKQTGSSLECKRLVHLVRTLSSLSPHT